MRPLSTFLLCGSLASFMGCGGSLTDPPDGDVADTNLIDAGSADSTALPDGRLSDTGEPVDAGAIDADPVQDMGRTERDSGRPAPGTMPIVVGVGWQGLTVVSIDEGNTWCQTGIMDSDHDDLFRGGGYHDGLFVGAHAGRSGLGAIITSTNGYQWTAQHPTNREADRPENPTHQWYGGAAYGAGTWVAAGGCGNMARSSDGLTWTAADSFVPGCIPIRSLVFGGGQFVAGDDDGTWWASADGVSWDVMRRDAGEYVAWSGTEFEGSTGSEPVYSRGRGVCLYSEGWPESFVMRSTHADCSGATEVATLPRGITVYLFGDVPASEYAPERLPGELRSCLGL